MTKIESTERYIERTKIPKDVEVKYSWSMADLMAMKPSDSFEVKDLIFRYGMAKGYRAAMAQREKVSII